MTNFENSISQKEKTLDDNEFKNLVYELESFIIDSFYDDKENSNASKTSLLLQLVDEKEKSFVHSKISPVLVCLGIQESVGGFRLLVHCVLEAARNVLSGKSLVMRDVYLAVSNKHGISKNNCERQCRYACSHICFDKSFALNFPYLEGLTHRTFEKITVKELVESLCSYLVVECKFKTKINNID